LVAFSYTGDGIVVLGLRSIKRECQLDIELIKELHPFASDPGAVGEDLDLLVSQRARTAQERSKARVEKRLAPYKRDALATLGAPLAEQLEPVGDREPLEKRDVGTCARVAMDTPQITLPCKF